MWEGNAVPLYEKGVLRHRKSLEIIYHMTINPTVLEAEERQAFILDANYDRVDVREHCETLNHLTNDEKQQLADLVEQFPILFGGGLGKLNIKPIHLELKPDAKPYAARAYPIPQALTGTTKKEINRLNDTNVFEENSDSEWAAPTFVIPKKTLDVRVVTDFRKLNSQLVRKPFPLPKIADLLQKLRNFRYATAIDLSMAYYHIPMDEHSQRLCTTIFPWGKYWYKVLPMGINNSPDIFQEVMNKIMGDLEFALTYLDDVLIVSNGTYEDHLNKVKTALTRLEKANFRANVQKCFFGEPSLEYLGYQISRKGIQPQPKKVEAIQKLQAPTNVRQLRHFLGMVNYYRDMWQCRSHILAPLTGLLRKKTPYKWENEHQKAFNEIKRVMAKQTILAFPDFAKEFHIYTDASNTQLGAVIMQDGKPLAFYSPKLDSAQKNYTTGEQELLSIVETLKEFRTLLWGQKLIVHTDHKNIVYGNLSNDHLIRWKMLLEEYGPKFVHIRGKDNVVADALSRLEFKENKHPEGGMTDDTSLDKQKNENGQFLAYVMTIMNQDHSIHIPDVDNELEMAQAYASKKEEEIENFPLSPEIIAKHQAKDRECKKYQTDKKFKIRSVEKIKVLMINHKMVIPRVLQPRILAWYHLYLRHSGSTMMHKTMEIAFWWKNMKQDVEYTVKT